MTRAACCGVLVAAALMPATAEAHHVGLALPIVLAQATKKPSSKTARTDNAPQESLGTMDESAVQSFWTQFDLVQSELSARQVTLPKTTADGATVAAIVDRAAAGVFYVSTGPTRYLVLHVRIGNRSERPLKIPREAVTATIDGDARSTDTLTSPLVNHSFMLGTEHLPLQQCQPPTEIHVPAQGVAGAWLVYPKVTAGGDLPKTVLHVRVGRQTIDIDALESQRALLGLNVERMGPRNSLAVLTVNGLLTTFNVQCLVDELDGLAAQKVVRAVIRWQPSTPAPDGQVLNWLQMSAHSVGTSRTLNDQLPQIHGAIRELHLVQLPQGNFPTAYYSGQMGPTRIHPTEAAAVAAALQSLLLTLPRSELRDQIENGSPLARAAALIHGAPLLDGTDLPRILRLSNDQNATLRIAALRTLGDFADQPAALQRLELAAFGGPDQDAAAAITALAESRYAAGHETMLRWLNSDNSALQNRIVAVLAEHPRPEWGDALFAHALDADGQPRVAVLRALAPLDHPRLVELLEQTLHGPNKSLRDFAFSILAHRTDERSDKLATDYALTLLQQSPPDSPLIEFLTRTKEARALPSLLRHLDSASDKGPLIHLLGQMGDRRTGDALAERYPRFSARAQVAALHALRALRHEKFMELAMVALATTDSMLIEAATQGLTQDASRAAVDVLIRGLEQQTESLGITLICNALAAISTPEARGALAAQRDSKVPTRKAAATQALHNLQLRSPGYAYVHQARAFQQSHQVDEALELYGVALQVDPQLVDAWAARGELLLRQEKWADAGKDLAKAYELDPDNGLACSGFAISQVMQGRFDAALNTVESARERLSHDVNFLYNSACVYGRMVETTLKQPDTPERTDRLAKFRRQGLTDLRQAVKLGFRDFSWMREDPDLLPLHDQKEFDEISRSDAVDKPDASGM